MEGRRYCQSEGRSAQLATFDYANDTFLNVSKTLFDASSLISFWIGYSQIGHKGQYAGVDDSTKYQHHWAYSEPNNANSLRDCVMAHSDRKWYAEQCKVKQVVLCKRSLGAPEGKKLSQCKFPYKPTKV
jgi:hypothetical protein